MTSEQEGFKPTKLEVYQWLEKQILCTIATNGDHGYPNIATVGFSQTYDLSFIIITDGESRKARNIMANEKVALVVTNEDDRYTLQVEGTARRLTWNEFEPYSEYHYKKLPFSLPFKDIPGQVPFLITPTHMRFSDVGVRPWQLTNIDL